MRRTVFVFIVALATLLPAVALAAPPGSRSDDQIDAGMEGEGFNVGVHWNIHQDPWFDVGVDVFDEDEEVGCGFQGVTSEGWSLGVDNEGNSALFMDLWGISLECEDGSFRSVDVHMAWIYSGKWGPTHYTEQGLQCKGKLLRDSDPVVYFDVSGDLEFHPSSATSSGYFEHRDVSCHDTGTPGKPQ